MSNGNFLFPSFLLIVVCDSSVRKITHFSPFIYLFTHLFILLRTHGYSSADKFLSFLPALQFFDFWELFAFYYPECLVLDNPAWDGGGDLSFHANLKVSITIMVHWRAVTALDDFFLVSGWSMQNENYLTVMLWKQCFFSFFLSFLKNWSIYNVVSFRCTAEGLSYTYTYTHSVIHIHIHIQLYICTFSYTYTHTHSVIYIHMHIQLYIYICTFSYTYTYTHSVIHIHIHIQLYMHTYIYSFSDPFPL